VVLLLVVVVLHWIGARALLQRTDGRMVVLVVLGSGGHTSEMLSMLGALEERLKRGIVFVVAETDKMSQQRAARLFPGAEFVKTPRAREVHQSWLTTVFTTFVAALHAIKIVFEQQPDLVLCNGPGTCVPVAYAAVILRLLFIKRARIAFTESIARTSRLSLSGRLLYPIADRFLVQWPQLAVKYPRAKHVGFVV